MILAIQLLVIFLPGLIKEASTLSQEAMPIYPVCPTTSLPNLKFQDDHELISYRLYL